MRLAKPLSKKRRAAVPKPPRLSTATIIDLIRRAQLDALGSADRDDVVAALQELLRVRPEATED
jgi:hypothetical protein